MNSNDIRVIIRSRAVGDLVQRLRNSKELVMSINRSGKPADGQRVVVGRRQECPQAMGWRRLSQKDHSEVHRGNPGQILGRANVKTGVLPRQRLDSEPSRIFPAAKGYQRFGFNVDRRIVDVQVIVRETDHRRGRVGCQAQGDFQAAAERSLIASFGGMELRAG